jgi:hypothetical protein
MTKTPSTQISQVQEILLQMRRERTPWQLGKKWHRDSNFKHQVEISPKLTTREICLWCEENCQGPYSQDNRDILSFDAVGRPIRPLYSFMEAQLYSFMEANDAMLFKLTWGGK